MGTPHIIWYFEIKTVLTTKIFQDLIKHCFLGTENRSLSQNKALTHLSLNKK